MPPRNLKRAQKLLDSWVYAAHYKQPCEELLMYFDGPWILEIRPTQLGPVGVSTLRNQHVLGMRIRDLVRWLVGQPHFKGLEGSGETYEWRLRRGSH